MPRLVSPHALLALLAIALAALALASPGSGASAERTACASDGWSHLWTWRC
jgi:hypothetical protein